MADGMLSREELLKRAAVLGGAGLVAGLGVGRAAAAIDALAAESGRLQVLDWAGYEVKQLWAPYAAKYPGDAGIGEDPAVVFVDDFEIAQIGPLPGGSRKGDEKKWDNSGGLCTITQQAGNVHSGSKALEMTIVRPDTKPGGAGV